MSRPTDLPAMAWEVLEMISSDIPISAEKHVSWARAFQQINWAASNGGRLALTAAGSEALLERRSSLGSSRASA